MTKADWIEFACKAPLVIIAWGCVAALAAWGLFGMVNDFEVAKSRISVER